MWALVVDGICQAEGFELEVQDSSDFDIKDCDYISVRVWDINDLNYLRDISICEPNKLLLAKNL